MRVLGSSQALQIMLPSRASKALYSRILRGCHDNIKVGLYLCTTLRLLWCVTLVLLQQHSVSWQQQAAALTSTATCNVAATQATRAQSRQQHLQQVYLLLQMVLCCLP